jgi:hypothetical protein
MTERYEWIPAPCADVFPGGKRWQLLFDGKYVGRIVHNLRDNEWSAIRHDTSRQVTLGCHFPTSQQAARALIDSLTGLGG